MEVVQALEAGDDDVAQQRQFHVEGVGVESLQTPRDALLAVERRVQGVSRALQEAASRQRVGDRRL